ncbi:hypothetical protein Droror1_Dr00008799 [Drosera rotundifolia]
MMKIAENKMVLKPAGDVAAEGEGRDDDGRQRRLGERRRVEEEEEEEDRPRRARREEEEEGRMRGGMARSESQRGGGILVNDQSGLSTSFHQRPEMGLQIQGEYRP